MQENKKKIQLIIEKGWNYMLIENKRILITGGTGSLGNVLLKRIISGELGWPQKITIFSRDETKQHHMKTLFEDLSLHDKVTRKEILDILYFHIGDVRNYQSISNSLKDVDIVFNAAAMKQVPSCEYNPFEAVRTNIMGPENIVNAIKENDLPVETVIGISTDKAVKPVNVMGMTKAIQERIFINANLICPRSRFVCVRYGNVLASRGSVIPLFHRQIRNGGPVTITTTNMTRFLLSLNQAVDTVFSALREAKAGETYIPRVSSAKVFDVADVLIDGRKIKKVITGIRPGEKIHEILVSEEEVYRTISRSNYYVIRPTHPELNKGFKIKPVLKKEYSSKDNLMSKKKILELLKKNKLTIENDIDKKAELLI